MIKSSLNMKTFLYLLIFITLFSKSLLFLSEENNRNIRVPPAVRLTLNGNNIADIEKIAISKILTEREFKLGPITLEQDIVILGKLSLVLNNTVIKLTNSTDAKIDLQFAEEKNINFILNLLKGEITFDYTFYTGFISSTGNATLYLNNISLSLNNTFIQVRNELEPEKFGPGLQIESILLNDLDIDFAFTKKGTFEKLLKYFIKNLKTIILKVAENQINKKSLLSKINGFLYDLLKNIKLSIPINNLLGIEENLNISFSMNEEPIAKNNILQVSLELEIIGDNYIYDETNNITLPHLYNNTELFTEKAINAIISQFIINNALDVVTFLGKLNLEITNDTLGIAEISVGLISALISEITREYKANQKLKIITNAVNSPVIKFNENNKVKLTLYENLQFFVYNQTENINEDIGTIPIVADSELEVEATFNVNGDAISITVSSMTMLTFEVKKSLVGEINSQKVVNNFKTFSFLMLGNVNNKIKSLIDKLPKPLIFEGILINELAAKSYNDCIKIDLSPILDAFTK